MVYSVWQTSKLQEELKEKMMAEGMFEQKLTGGMIEEKIGDLITAAGHEPAPEKVNRYRRLIKTIVVPASDTPTTIEVTADFYDIAEAWQVHCPATQHAIKKLLQPGARGHKDTMQDLVEALSSIERAIELEESRDDNA